MNLRAFLWDYCSDFVKERTSRLQKAIKDLEADLGNETKSSAGDKYETSREMINAEINKLQNQLQEFKKLNQVLNIVSNRNSSPKIQLGSVVKTSQANYYLAIPAGKINFQDETYFAIGINSPIGQLLMGKQVGEKLVFQQKEFVVVEVI
jgi:transcription elongation GreA/GreB family factor